MSCSHGMTMFRDIAVSRVEDPNSTPEQKFAVTGSLILDLPPTLVIKSADLRVLDPVGQGYKYSYFNRLSSHSKQEKINNLAVTK